MSKKMNLEDLAIKHGIINGFTIHSSPTLAKQSFINYSKNLCKQILELAARKIKSDALETYGTDIPDCWDENSILDTINEIE